MALDPEFKAKWVEALRSRKFRQANDTLREQRPGRHYAYCCLGVACQLVDPKGWRGGEFEFKDVTDAGYPPDSLMEHIGLDPSDARKLAGMNDHGSTFPEIATYIEENL